MCDIKDHIRFICSRVCHVKNPPRPDDNNFIRQFNYEFTEVLNSINSEFDLYDLEDIYTSAKHVMESHANNLMAKRILTVINYRLKKLQDFELTDEIA